MALHRSDGFKICRPSCVWVLEDEHMRREPLAITVAATTPEDARLWISPGVGSNYGKCVDVWAPGSDILSASHRSDRATEYRSGTSQAVPFVAGTAALFLQNSTGALCERAWWESIDC